MKKYVSILLSLCLLAGCKAPAGASPRPAESAVVTESPVHISEAGPTPEPDWEGMMARLEPGDIQSIFAYVPGKVFLAEDLAPLIRRAMVHPVENYGEDWEAIWDLPFTLTADRQMTLYAGLEENIVCLSLPGKTLWVEDEALYQFVRTSMDRDEVINDYWYEKYRDLVDGYFDARVAEINGRAAEGEPGWQYSGWELTEFLGYAGTSKVEDLGVTLFRMNAAYLTDPAEDAVHMLAGGAYVDSRLRVHAPSGWDGGNVYLMVVDNEAVGFVYGENMVEVIQDVETVKQFRQRQMAS